MMYYRRKALLALVEAFGGTLQRTDCQKLLFLFCRSAEQNYYDFFPHKYGGFSFLVQQDKKRLIDLGFLRDSVDFRLNSRQSFLDQLRPSDRLVLAHMSDDLAGIRGKELIRRVYLGHPEYCRKSSILSEVLTQEELENVTSCWCVDESPGLFTIGYQGLTIDAYLCRLILSNVKAVVDVRQNAFSMKYDFSKARLQKYLQSAEITYIHVPELGVPSTLRRRLGDSMAYQALFEYYRSTVLPRQAKALDDLRTRLSKQRRIALTCFESDYRLCHRHEITECLASTPGFETRVVHF
jgi:uncharacterized protein (DUF488 family)